MDFDTKDIKAGMADIKQRASKIEVYL